jgi:glycogen(starch) synthase
MNILHLASEYPPQQVFGLGRFVRDLAEELARQGHRVTVITNSIGGHLADTMQGGVRVLRIDFPPPPKPPQSTGCIMVFNIYALRRALDLGIQQLCEFDVVCSHDWLTAPAAQAISHCFGITHICTFHDTIIGKRLGRIEHECDQFSAQAEKWMAHSATHVIANSNATRQELISLYGANSDKVTVIPCAVAPDSFPTTDDPVRLSAFRESIADENEFLILYVGRLDPEKGVNNLLKAFASAKLSGVRLCVAGVGLLFDQLRSLAHELGITEKTTFLGYVENPALAHLYHCADVLVCPSLYEPFGMVCVEGMLQGLPVIASSTGGLQDLIQDGENGLLVPPNDVNALAEALRKIIANSACRKVMGANARNSVLKNRTWPTLCKHTEALYEKHKKEKTSRKLSIVPTYRGSPIVICDHGFGQDYTPGRYSRRLQKHLISSDPETRSISSDADDVFPLSTQDRQDQAIIHAFNMASRLLYYGHFDNCNVAASHWDGVLAASILPKQKRRIDLHCLTTEIQVTNSSTTDTFDTEILKWAVKEASTVYVQDQRSVASFADQGVAAKVQLIPEFNGIQLGDLDKPIFRACFAEPECRLAVVPLRLEPPFWPEALLETAAFAANARIPLRWVVCGDGSQLPELKIQAKQRNLPIHFTGPITDVMQDCILAVSDITVAPLRRVVRTALCYETISHSKPILAPNGTAKIVGLPDSNIIEVDFSNAPEVVGALARALKSAANDASKYQTMDKPNNGLYADHTPDQLVLYNNWGIGDELLLSAVAREIKVKYPKKRVWIRSRHNFAFPNFCEACALPPTAVHVETIYQNPVMYGPGGHSPFPGHLVQQMLDKVALDTGICVIAKNVRPEIIMPKHLPNRNRNDIIVHCMANQRLPSKDWGLERWKRLCDILHEQRYNIIQIGDLSDPQLPHVIDKRGVPVARLPEVMVSANLVICLVGFIMHMAAATSTNAVVIYGGREHPAIDGYEGQFHLCTDPLECRGRWGCHLAPDTQCPHGMRCMEHLTPELLAEITAVFTSEGRAVV